jgi:hypothetical protein
MVRAAACCGDLPPTDGLGPIQRAIHFWLSHLKPARLPANERRAAIF